MTPSEIFNKAYDILVEHAGADPKRREMFVRAYIDTTGSYPATEYRFMGTLGGGGKFYRYNDRYFVTCYPECETPERRKTIEKVTTLLQDLPYWEPPPQPRRT